MASDERQETLAEIEEELRSGEYAPLADRIHAAWEREKSQSWHHREMEELILRHEKEVAELKKLIPQPDPDWKAICEKCHDGDIEQDCEYYGEPNGCNSPIYGEHPKEKPVGNAAARDEVVLRLSREEYKGMQEALSEHDRLCEMLSESRKSVGNAAATREALKAINCINTGGLKRLLVELVEADIFDGGLINKTISAVEKARRALSAPPRNCDVGTSEEQEKRFYEKFCVKSCLTCPLSGLKRSRKADCIMIWAQMPYEAQEGGAQ